MMRKYPRKQIKERPVLARIRAMVARAFPPTPLANGAGEDAYKGRWGRFDALMRDYREKTIALDVSREELKRNQSAIVEALRVFGVHIEPRAPWNGKRETAFADLVPFMRNLKADLDTARMQRDQAAGTASQAASAWLLDRSEQYEYESGIPGLICDLAKGIAEGEHLTAAAHGELDDLIETVRKATEHEWSMPMSANATKGQGDERQH